MSSWLETSQEGGRGFDGTSASILHGDLANAGRCDRIPQDASARPRGFTSISNPEAVNTSAAAAARNRARSRHAADTARFPSTRLIDAGASSGTRGSAIRGWTRWAAAPFGSGRLIGTPGRPPRSTSASTGSPRSDGPRTSLTAAHNNPCLVCAAIVQSCPPEILNALATGPS